MMLIALGVQASASETQSRKSQVFSYLTESLGFNSAAACGIMANIEHESNFDSSLVIIDCNGRPSGGLCQWNGGRFRNLQNFCNQNGYSYLSIKGQLEYLKHELKDQSYKHINNYLKSVPDTEGGAYDAAYYWCYHFERPRNRSGQSASRGASAIRSYWPRYRISEISTVDPYSGADDKTLDLSEIVRVGWDQASGGVTSYLAQVAPKENGSFNWEKARTYPISKSARLLTLNLSDLGVGRYAVRVFGQNDYTGVTGKCKDAVKFNVACLHHDYKLTDRVEPTLDQAGKDVFVCEKCGQKHTEKKDTLSCEQFEKNAVQDFDATETSASTGKLEWKPFSGAQGYRIWQRIGEEWVKLTTLKPDVRSYTAKKLDSASRCAFKIEAFGKNGEETVWSDAATASAWTRPDDVKLTKASRTDDGLKLKWEKSDQAQGYTIYACSDSDGEYTPVASADAKAGGITLKDLKGSFRYFRVAPFLLSAKGTKIHAKQSNALTAA